ncbi:hypothetical protein S-PM2d008 [Synechococcus phage S-PM2]|uniref:Hypothetical-Protein / belonging to T4-LIKE GC: 754 n=1 Tax=Synechococcus phage S-PM2 TaxID=238854 RepID=Q5GQR2_BPSYP|nr:Hypothetical-Protein / belonging to T4-LIKE GC: 754 [Synechococcus phage S-PM2]CAF34072.2 Hypothetical-Protein / belonging to T4-LIKE GC: 754 [Synechococcus phage S-PM2]CFW42145.1 hypothetical protein S-PM2d008 [Synechococcus phage S-PM2]
MTYNAEVQFKFDATWTPTYGSSFSDDEFIPEEHYLITAPAGDLNAKQYFKLFEKFMLCVGMCPQSIRSGAMSLVFNDWTSEEEQRKVCKEYELTMDEDLRGKFEDWKKAEEEFVQLKKGPMGTVLDDAWEITDPHGTIVTDGTTSNHPKWEDRYWSLYRRFQKFAKFTDEQLAELVKYGEERYYQGE